MIYSCTDSKGNFINYKYITKGKIHIVFFPGFMSNINSCRAKLIENFCISNNYSYLSLDYYGHGISSGTNLDVTISMCKESAITVLNSLAKNSILFFVGSSMGSWIMHLVSDLYSNRIIGMVGFASAPDFTKYLMWDSFSLDIKNQILSKGLWESPYYPITLQLIQDGSKNLILDKHFNFKFPVTLIHGLKDDRVPAKYTRILANRHTNQDLITCKFIDSVGHSFSSELEMQEVFRSIQKIISNFSTTL
jgi:uncharacterized protein